MSADSLLLADAAADAAVKTAYIPEPYLNGVHPQSLPLAPPEVWTRLPTVVYHTRELPTFPLETGWRERVDLETNTHHIYPLTLIDLLFPDQDELGVLVMPESPLHDLWSGQMATTIRTNLKARNWLILHDVFIYWRESFISPAAPDLAIIPDGPVLPDKAKSYQVGSDGPLPLLVGEIISDSSRTHDTETKRSLYAAVGIKEYLVVDLHSMESVPWQVIGYRLGDTPYYDPIPLDADGGVTFPGVGLRFVPVDRTRIDIYDLTTGERLLTADELKARAEAEAAAREQAEAAREQAEAAREQAEAAREQAEAAREQAEAAREQAEARRAAEAARSAKLEAFLRSKGLLPPSE